MKINLEITKKHSYICNMKTIKNNIERLPQHNLFMGGISV